MKTIIVNINGKDYPCRQTLGAMLEFKRVTGREVTNIKADDLSDSITLFWCYIKSACRADKVEFPYSLEEFADSVNMDVLTEFTKAEVSEKKKAKQAAASQ